MFFFVGASRTGSTWLYWMLKKHPQIFLPIKKPVRFWNKKIFGLVDEKSPYPILDLHTYLELHKPKKDKVVGDMTDGYNVIGVEEISAIKHFYPDATIIFNCRNPSELLTSHVLLHQPIEKLNNLKNVKRIMNNENSYIYRNTDQAKNIKRWQSVFSEDQIHILFYDDMRDAQKIYLENFSKIIQVDPSFWSNPALQDKLGTRMNQRKSSIEPDQEIKIYLQKVFSRKVKELGALTGRNLSDWGVIKDD